MLNFIMLVLGIILSIVIGTRVKSVEKKILAVLFSISFCLGPTIIFSILINRNIDLRELEVVEVSNLSAKWIKNHSKYKEGEMYSNYTLGYIKTETESFSSFVIATKEECELYKEEDLFIEFDPNLKEGEIKAYKQVGISEKWYWKIYPFHKKEFYKVVVKSPEELKKFKGW